MNIVTKFQVSLKMTKLEGVNCFFLKEKFKNKEVKSILKVLGNKKALKTNLINYQSKI